MVGLRPFEVFARFFVFPAFEMFPEVAGIGIDARCHVALDQGLTKVVSMC